MTTKVHSTETIKKATDWATRSFDKKLIDAIDALRFNEKYNDDENPNRRKYKRAFITSFNMRNAACIPWRDYGIVFSPRRKYDTDMGVCRDLLLNGDINDAVAFLKNYVQEENDG